jgi:hypothetical protein
MTSTRNGERVPILGEVTGEIMVLEPLLVKELGTGGATIETRFPLPLNSLHDLRFSVGTHAVVVKARVVHSHTGEAGPDMVYTSGVEFVEAPAYVDAAITQYLDALKTQR